MDAEQRELRAALRRKIALAQLCDQRRLELKTAIDDQNAVLDRLAGEHEQRCASIQVALKAAEIKQVDAIVNRDPPDPKLETLRRELLAKLDEANTELEGILKAEVLAECDEQDPRLSIATEKQITDALSSRGIGAVLITFEYGVLSGVEDPTGAKFGISSTDELDENDLKAFLAWLGNAMLRR